MMWNRTRLIVTLALLAQIGARNSGGGRRTGRAEKCAKRGLPFVDCIIPPCRARRQMEMECEAYPDAQCVNEYCGGCVAKHYIGDREVHCGYERGVICELHNTSLSCPVNHIMKIKHANYGRTNPYTCRHSYNFDAMHNSTRCFSVNATRIVSRLCEGRTACWPTVSSTIFGDSCYGVYKYLKVDFDCVPIQNYFAKTEYSVASAQSQSTSYRHKSCLLLMVFGYLTTLL